MEILKINSLYDRREEICLTFTKKCTKSKNLQVRRMSPLNKSNTTAKITYENKNLTFNQICVKRVNYPETCHVTFTANKNRIRCTKTERRATLCRSSLHKSVDFERHFIFNLHESELIYLTFW